MSPEIASLFTDEEVFSLPPREVRDFFRRHQVLFNSLTGLRFLASRRRLMKRFMTRPFKTFQRFRRIRYSHRKSSFIFRHNFLDLLAPRGMHRDYVFKRAVSLPAFLKLQNQPLGRVVFRILSSLFLLYSTYQR